MKKKIKKRRLKKKNFVGIILTLIFIGIFSFSLYHIICWVIDSKNTKDESKKTNKVTEIKEIKGQVIENNEEPKKDDPYWDFIKMKLIDVDINKLKEINPDTIGWIQVNGTNINYPIVQTTDNDYYLSHSFYKKKNEAGWVFMDYRNNNNTFNKNTIIYAHGRYDNTMFGSLKNALKSGWTNNKNNYVVKLSTEKENTLWQVFSVYHIPTTTDYLQIDFSGNNEFKDFSNKLLSRSEHNFMTDVNENDYILTLSTCYNNEERVVLHAKLIMKNNS